MRILLKAAVAAVLSFMTIAHAMAEDAPLARVGSSFTFGVTADSGNGEEVWTRLPDKEFRGQRAVQIQSIRTNTDGETLRLTLFHDPATGSWMAATYGDLVVDEAFPHNGQFKVPLEVGATWTQSHRREQGPFFADKYNVTGTWAVEALEDVATPAGTFSAFRVHGVMKLPDGRVLEENTLWISTTLGMMVKSEIDRKIHFKVPGRTAYLLKSYQLQ
ncbi:MAG: hypothetical protein GC134_02505 [Proteobacteria bacterium]|nr:hypothetical protein [Pseudomonadota bacterium]